MMNIVLECVLKNLKICFKESRDKNLVAQSEKSNSTKQMLQAKLFKMKLPCTFFVSATQVIRKRLSCTKVANFLNYLRKH